MAVSKYHFPEVQQLGDITKLDGAKLPPVDIICAGSPCFTVGASIQTKNGIKPIEKIVVGDMVIADDCEWHKVVEIMRNQAESIYTIKAQGLLELEATGNHPFLVKHMKRHYPTKNGKRCNSRKFSKAEWVKVENLQKGDFVGYPILQTSENIMSITKEEAWLIGRYIADGYTNNSQRKGRPLGQKNHKVIYCIGKGKLDNFKSKISQYHVCYKKDATVTKGEVISERLMRLCMLCGKGAEHKEIPGIFLDLPKELLQELISGYVSGDGSKTGNSYRATTISKKLALSLQSAIHKAYQRPAKVYYDERPKKTTIQGREVNQKDTYTVIWLDNIPKQSQAIVGDGYIWQPIREIKRKEQKTIVYNFEVADVHSYTVNGIMVHNCQDLSIAGKREGLAGERSGLFRKAIDIVRDMQRNTNGEYPKWFVWENVPGAFSSNKGHDFRVVLEEITETDIPMPDSGRWSKGGLVRSPKCNVAWRTLDAQYWGVPQRRARIFLIAGFGADSRPEVLFEPESLSRDTEESQDERKGTAGDTAQSADTTSWAFEPGITSLDGRKLTENKSTTLRADMGDNQTAVLAPAVMQSIGLDLYNGNITGDIAATITASSGKSASQSGPSVMQKCYGISSYESNGMKSQNPSSGIYEADKARTLDTSGGNPACNQGGIAVIEAKTIGIATQSYYDMQISDKGATLRAAGGTYGGAVRIMPCKLASGKNVTGTIMANCGTKQFLGNQEAFSGDYFIIEDNKKCNIL
jgi:site-specific DNA-cytosine methylase